jgi:hypothetical protein
MLTKNYGKKKMNGLSHKTLICDDIRDLFNILC